MRNWRAGEIKDMGNMKSEKGRVCDLADPTQKKE